MKEHGYGRPLVRLRSSVNLKVISLNHTGFNCAARLMELSVAAARGRDQVFRKMTWPDREMA